MHKWGSRCRMHTGCVVVVVVFEIVKVIVNV
jgi:hypothetical protein